MHPEPLVSAFGKIEWAITPIKQLETDIRSFFSDSAYEIVSHLSPEGANVDPVRIWRYRISKPIPQSIYAQTSAILALLHEPLGQVLSAVALTNPKKGVKFRVDFPGADTRQKFKARLREQKERLPLDAIKLLLKAGPYLGGPGERLAAVHILKTPDKHSAPLMPVAFTGSMKIRAFFGTGKVYTVGPRKGAHYRKHPNTLNLDPTPTPPQFEVDKGVTFHAPTPEDSLEIATSSADAQIGGDLEPAFSIAFGQIAGIGRQPIVQVLTQARDDVETLLKAFSTTFFP